jgi:serine/threonine protein kinase
VDTQPNPSIRVKGFRIEALIGRGGMGQVYRAKQLNLNR